MIRKDCLKSVFESLIVSNRVNTPFGIYSAKGTTICVFAVGSLFAIGLFKTIQRCGEFEDYLISRSYPMSYKSAYRLVCSL